MNFKKSMVLTLIGTSLLFGCTEKENVSEKDESIVNKDVNNKEVVNKEVVNKEVVSENKIKTEPELISYEKLKEINIGDSVETLLKLGEGNKKFEDNVKSQLTTKNSTTVEGSPVEVLSKTVSLPVNINSNQANITFNFTEDKITTKLISYKLDIKKAEKLFNELKDKNNKEIGSYATYMESKLDMNKETYVKQYTWQAKEHIYNVSLTEDVVNEVTIKIQK